MYLITIGIKKKVISINYCLTMNEARKLAFDEVVKNKDHWSSINYVH